MLTYSDRATLESLQGDERIDVAEWQAIRSALRMIDRMQARVERLEREARERSPSRWADDGEDTRKCSPDALTLRLLDQQANTCARLFNILEAVCAAKGGGDR